MSAAAQSLFRCVLYRGISHLMRRRPLFYQNEFATEILCRGRSSAFSSLQHTSSENSSSNDIDRNNDSLAVQVSDDGLGVSLNFACDGSENVFHASWLWSNDPQGVVLPSGQRTTTPSHWIRNGRPKINDAKIIHCDVSNDQNSKSISKHIIVPGPTLNDCCHPLAIYGNSSPWVSSSIVDENESSRPYLLIAWSDQSTSIYDVQWLQRFQYNDNSRLERRVKSEVQPMHAVRKHGPPLWYAMKDDNINNKANSLKEDTSKHEADGLAHIDYNLIIGQDGRQLRDGLFDLLHFLFRDGAVIVSNAPTAISDLNNCNKMIDDESMPVAQLARVMSGGAISHGMLYGDIFHVRSGERNSNNVAYTSAALCPHQDLAYYESPPGVQLLHCVAMGKDVVGGESNLIDALAAAYRLRELRPNSFEILSRCPATFMKQREGACMTYLRPHISLAEGRCSIFDREITAVHWSPPFEGPLCIPAEDIEQYYEAYTDFECMLNADLTPLNEHDKDLASYADEFTWKRKLKTGEVLVFNNRRMLHGRSEFQVADGAMLMDGRRHLVGCYTNIDDTLNTYRVGLREKNDYSSASLLNVGNGTTIF